MKNKIYFYWLSISYLIAWNCIHDAVVDQPIDLKCTENLVWWNKKKKQWNQIDCDNLVLQLPCDCLHMKMKKIIQAIWAKFLGI